MLKTIAEVSPELLSFIEALQLPLPQAAWWSQPAHIMNPGDTCRVYTNEDHPEHCAYLKDGLEVLIDQYCNP